ncbi:uncharacterized protein Z520_03018 [Fonsecaea multimorphosa CBS 102226]|uniref:DUF7580 domain-containing protein n=1 Tax=Fonsecaea multimorphosa CBS 102226 TaxID=1442371 RepID=A0A0D2HHV5_9EURO|nr:uncharacterized protein Z520_03018 [Fonsecaea multimorphosa CBS 102226]KIY01466.1 hypothetical protein Z520_03018 [Fonsecaea multimorphosa CBS 102226]OAL28230.1 hypothetical protein AYO22_02936 [Fonsecaea multimorphosa]
MSGLEIVGTVLAVIPLLLPALDLYKNGLSRVSVFLRRRKHVEKLIHALHLQKTLLTENVRTLAIRAGVDVDDIPEDPRQLFELLHGDDDLKGRVEAYLGTEANELYMSAVVACEEVVRNIVAHIEGFLPAGPLTQPGSLIVFIQANRHSVGNGLDLRARFNLTLGKSDVDKSIQELDRSILILDRLSAAVAANRDATESSISRTATKFAAAVAKTRDNAERLYSAIANGWTCKFHKSHEVKLRLDRSPPALTRAALKTNHSPTKELVFEVVFRCDQPQNDIIWHESRVEMLEDPHVNGAGVTAAQSATTVNSRPKVIISVPPKAKVLPATSQKVVCLCTSLHGAVTANKALHLYIASQTNMHCDQRECPAPSSAGKFDVRSLREFLSIQGGHYRRIALRDRMLLALTLAISLLQLHETPWLYESWSKETIQFMKAPGAKGKSVATLDIDFTRPLISREFFSPSHGSPKHLQPKEALLELGIMLLELWYEKTIEDQFPGDPLPADYWGKLRLASIWLEDTTNPLLPQYRLAVAQCVKCFFGGGFSSPSWDDFEFRKALVRDMVEPLHENCKPWL